MTGYAIIAVGGKQYRVQEGQQLLVDRVATDEGKTFQASVLMLGGDGKTDLTPQGVTVTARVVAHVKGEKVRIGKYRQRTGYRRHTGFRASLSQLEIERIGSGKATAAKAAQPKPEATEAAARPAPAKEERAVKTEERPTGMPKGYEEMTVAEIAEAAPGWRRPMLEAALTYERAHAARKGAIGAIEHALAAKEEKS
jgi:large subunit ribosomal protein L21